jgi:capsular exopolysaccharide synthesis family protein
VANDRGRATLRFDLGALLTVLRRNLVPVAAILAGSLIAGLLLTWMVPPRYVATASVQIDQEADRVLEGTEVRPVADDADAERFLQTQTDVLRSRSLAIQVAQRLKLFGNRAFFAAMKAPSGDTAKSGREATLRLLQAELTVHLPRNSRVVEIAFESPDPVLAARIANTYASEFIRTNLQRKFDSSAYARDFLSRQLAAAKDRLETSERELNDYARSAGLIRTGGGIDGSSGMAPASVTSASLVQLNAAANDARAARVSAEEKWRAVSTAPLMTIPEVLGNQAIERLLEQRAAGAAELQRERARHLGGHPGIRQLQSRQAELDRQVGDIAQAIRASIYDRYREAWGRERALAGQVEALKGDTLEEQDRNVRYTILAREADTNRTLYDGLLQRYKELSAAAEIRANNLSIVDMAEPPPSPASPRLALNLLAALAAGMLVAVATVLVREQLDDAVRAPEEVEDKLGLPLLGAIPLARAVDAQMEQPRSPMSEAYSALSGALLGARPHGLPRTLLVTSSQPGEGKSTTSLAIAAGLARLGKQVVLVDADLRRPALHRMLTIANDRGLSEVLVRSTSLDSALQRPGGLGFAILPAGNIPARPPERLGSPGMAAMMAALLDRFDVVVLDGPPVLGLADAPMLATGAEGTVFVVEAGSSSGGAKAALRRLRTARSALLGAVLTKFDVRKAGVGHRYYRANYYSYGAAEMQRQAAE